MRIQRTVIEKSEYPSMYFRGGTYESGGIRLKKGEAVTFDTYFNSLDYPKYRDYTNASSVTLQGTLSGTAHVSLRTYDGKEDTTVSEADASGNFSLAASFSALPKSAFLYLAIEATEEEVLFSAAEYHVDAPASFVDCAIAFCTYRREEYLKHNLEVLSLAKIPYLNRIIVVDNGHTVTEGMIPEEANVALFQNLNYGGSAGFTRGIMEARRAGHTHVILMDDDIVIYPEAIERITVFASILREEFKNAHFSAAMLHASRPYLQHAKGDRWTGSHIESMHNKLDVRSREAVAENLKDGPIGYGAWWCFCLPLSDVDKFGLPLPLFIKFDDVEYGTRCCKNAPIVTMSGMAVAHADFDSKYSMQLEYYAIRNMLIMLAVHREQNAFGCIFRLMKLTAKFLFLYRYDAMPIILRAFDDFLKGADFIMKENAEELNRSVMTMPPKGIALSSLPDWDPSMREAYVPSKKNLPLLFIKLLTLGGHLIPRCFMKKKTAVCPLPSPKIGDCFMHRRTIQYQMEGDSGFVFEKSSPRFFSCIWKGVKMSFRILFTYRRASKSYYTAREKLMSEEFWTDYLKI